MPVVDYRAAVVVKGLKTLFGAGRSEPARANALGRGMQRADGGVLVGENSLRQRGAG